MTKILAYVLHAWIHTGMHFWVHTYLHAFYRLPDGALGVEAEDYSVTFTLASAHIGAW